MRSIVLIVAVAAIVFGQHGPASAHSAHVDPGYKMPPMPPPNLMTGIGTSALKITTKSAEAQAYFSQGMSLLHCFWDFEAYRANWREHRFSRRWTLMNNICRVSTSASSTIGTIRTTSAI